MQPCLGKTFQPQTAGVTAATGEPLGGRVVAGMGLGVIDPQGHALLDNLGLGQIDQRSMNSEVPGPFHPAFVARLAIRS